MNEIRKLLGYAKHVKMHMAVITITSIILGLLSLTTPYVLKLATDWVVDIASGKAEFSWSGLLGLITIQLVATGLVVIATDVGGWHGDSLSVKVRQQLSNIYFSHLLDLPQQYYDNEITGKIVNRLGRAITGVSGFLQFFANNLLQMLLSVVVAIIVLLIYSWPLAILFVLFIPANLLLTARSSGKWQAYEKQINEHFDIASGRFTEVVSQMRLVKSFGSQKNELNKFNFHLKKMIGLTNKQSSHWHSMNAIRGVVFGILFAGIYMVVFYQTANKMLSVGDMVLLVALIQQLALPLRNLSYFVDSYQKAVANSKDFLKAMKELPESHDEDALDLVVKNSDIEFDNVSFAYKNNEKVLHDIAFKIREGEKVALVGESGGGKTTITNLLMGLYRPLHGKIIIGGQDLAQVSFTSLRRNISTVFQDPAMFSGTVRENIAYSNLKAGDEEIEKAAKAANAHDFISKLSNGYNTEIGERGIKLSGGQKQRIAIARALLKDAPILVLDEATSSLDSRSEVLVQNALERLMKGRTVLIIAHRLSTIAHADVIVTLKDGRVDEVGSPSELASTGGIYAQLLKIQAGITEPSKNSLAKFDIAE
jgi:ATP-binding cassette subfamily B protein